MPHSHNLKDLYMTFLTYIWVAINILDMFKIKWCKMCEKKNTRTCKINMRLFSLGMAPKMKWELIFCNVWTHNLYRWKHNDSWLIQLHCGFFVNITNVIFVASDFGIWYRATILLNIVQSLQMLAHCVSCQTEDSKLKSVRDRSQ